jgi:NitT/TauT family transport system permease protein
MTTSTRVAAAGQPAPLGASPANLRWRLGAARASVPLVVLLVWQLVAPHTDLVPGPVETLTELSAGFTEGWIYNGLIATGTAVAAGFVVGAAVALPLGYLLGRSRTLTAILEPMVAGTFAVPRIILYPILLAIFGVGLQAEAWIVGISAFFPILMSTAAAVRNVSATLVKLGHSLNASRLQIARKIIIPEAAPGLMVGIRIGFSIAFVAAIIAELFAAKDGIGQQIARAQGLLDLPRVYALVVLVLIAAFLGNMLLWSLERRLRRG